MYRKVGDIVYLRGLAKKGTSGQLGRCRLGSAPPSRSSASRVRGRSANLFVVMDVTSDGFVGVSGNFTLPDYVMLDTIQFSVTP